MTHRIGYEFIKAEARRRRKAGEDCHIGDLLALASKNDPFYTGTPAEVKKARWFAGLWQRFGYGHGVHLRRVHYQIVSQENTVLMHNGKPYENTEKCWGYLTGASKYARYLDLVPTDAFVDRRNPDAIEHAEWAGDLQLDVSVGGAFFDGLELPEYEVYGGTGHIQPYLVEIWAEKTTMNDILEPLCERYQANLVTGAGELSITAVMDFLHRVRRLGKPARLLYVSDFDPAGLGMPVSVARKIEFYQRRRGFEGLDITLDPIALTASQVRSYRLPRVPVKDSDKRKANFEQAYGEGQVELDALEALHSGSLSDIVETAILDYYDADLAREAARRRRAITDHLSQQRQAVLDRYGDQIAALEREVKDLRQAVRKDLGAVEVDPEALELPEPGLIESHGKLYESGRGYFEQLHHYKAHQEGKV